jgi:hypothetical protein
MSSEAPAAEPPSAADPAAAGADAAGTPAAPARPVFLSFEERREVVEGRPRRGGHGHQYEIRFYLADAAGGLTLAAIGEDTGDCHYNYSSVAGFPEMVANNRTEVKVWLARVCAVSQSAAGFTPDVVVDELPQNGAAPRLPLYVAQREEREELADGRHVARWYLIDSGGHGHLAVVGTEKETRDGHYHYETQPLFAAAGRPLASGSQEAVRRWLDEAMTHSAAAAAALAARPAHRGPGRPRGAGGALLPTGGRAGSGGTLLRQAAAKRARAAWRAHDPDREPRELVAAELRRWGQEEAGRREGARRGALAFAGDAPDAAAAAALERALPALRVAAGAPGALPPPGAPGSPAQQRTLVAALSALRELGHVSAPLALAEADGLRPALAALAKHRRPEVAAAARGLLDQWLRAAAAHVFVLTEPRYVQDPRPTLEAALADRARLDAATTAVTGRAMRPREAAAPAARAAAAAAPGTAERRRLDGELAHAPSLGGAASASLLGAGAASASAAPAASGDAASEQAPAQQPLAAEQQVEEEEEEEEEEEDPSSSEEEEEEEPSASE